MSNKKNLQVFEHQVLKADDASLFKTAHFNALEKYGYATKEKYFTVGNKRIKFSNYVGVIQVKDLTIEVLPKADAAAFDDEKAKAKWHSALLQMLHECKLIKLDAISSAKLKLKSASILELYYDAFLTETEKLVRHGLKKAYHTQQDNLSKVKGKIIFNKHLQKNYIHREKFYVEHKVYDRDNKLNQILLKALLILDSLISKPDFSLRIKKLLLHFEGVHKKSINASWFETLRFDRNTERYKPATTLAKLFILKHAPDLKGGAEDVLAILFDMNRLFENYIYRKLKVLEVEGLVNRVREQNRLPFWESRGIKADILVETDRGNIVIDTKWKVLKENKPSDEDLKQMFVYNLHYKADLSILLYPKLDLETGEKKPFKDKLFSKYSCQLAFIDVFNESVLEKKLGYIIYDKYLVGSY
jgi:5-methylcytosine-specific restriction enzyme subunit McrC